MNTLNAIQLKPSTAAKLRRIAAANRRQGETIGAALRRLATIATPAIGLDGEVGWAFGGGLVLREGGSHLYSWGEGFPWQVGWWLLRQLDGHEPKTSATPGCAYGAYYYW